MKKMLSIVAFVVVTVVLTGCSSLETTEKFNSLGISTAKTKPVAHVNVDIWGVFLFNSIPIMSGSVNTAGKLSAFMDTVTLDNAMLMMTRRARGIGASKVLNVTSDIRSYWLWYTLLFWCREVQVSGTAVE
ncbi:hypothetical protein P0136_07975 [Lentisphaerota bacterium ZTH]|nr:hypothetical protein JYG24_00915 [Lentisphaerota bacterium]WET05301.1 hypothetical protein P0136_07975 [Lentisphaerota bacterium ZTH]